MYTLQTDRETDRDRQTLWNDFKEDTAQPF